MKTDCTYWCYDLNVVAGLLTEEEYDIIKEQLKLKPEIDQLHTIPIAWAFNIVVQEAAKKKEEKNDNLETLIITELFTINKRCCDLLKYDSNLIPLVYTQVSRNSNK